LQGEGDLNSAPLPIRRITDTQIDNINSEKKFINIAVLHPTQGVYLYSIDINERDMYSKNVHMPIE
jgi:uncharacterized membrane protein